MSGNLVPRLFKRYAKIMPKISSVAVRWKSNDTVVSSSQSVKSNSVKGKRSKKSPLAHIQMAVSPSFKTESFQPKSVDLVVDIKQAKSLVNLLEIASKHGSRLKSVHLLDIFRQILIFQQNPMTKLDLQVLQKNQGFLILCHMLRKLAPSMQKHTDLIDCLNTLVVCKVDKESRVIYTLIELLQHRVKELSLTNILSLSPLLSKLNGFSLFKGLHNALVLSFESQLETQLQRDNVALMLDALLFARTHDASYPKKKFIMDNLLASDKNKWSLANVLIAVHFLKKFIPGTKHTQQTRSDFYVDFIRASLKRLAELIYECEQIELLSVMLLLSRYHELNSRIWYNQQFFERVAERAVLECWSLDATVRVAHTHSIFFFVHTEVLEYLATLIVGNKFISQKDPLYLLVPFASTNYRPVNFEAVMKALLSSNYLKNNQSVSPEKKKKFMLRFFVTCAILNAYPTELINDVFKKNFFEEYLTEDHSLKQWVEMNRALRSIRIECPDYRGFFPDNTFLEMANQKTFERQQKFPRTLIVEETLQKALGGPPYVASDLMTRYGHYVDHALVMRPGGFPVAISLDQKKEDTLRYVEDVRVPNGCQLMLIQAFRPEDYVINIDQLNGYSAIDLRTLRLLGYDVITFNSKQVSELREHQRIPFLMHEIHQRLKVQKIS